jgi:inner membrane transporter RhtA
VNRVVGARVPGAQGPAAAAGLLSSALPMVGDVLALRRIPARFFGVFMSVNPVFAALAGLLILGQSPGRTDWLAITAIVAVNAVTAAGRRPLPLTQSRIIVDSGNDLEEPL